MTVVDDADEAEEDEPTVAEDEAVAATTELMRRSNQDAARRDGGVERELGVLRSGDFLARSRSSNCATAARPA